MAAISIMGIILLQLTFICYSIYYLIQTSLNKRINKPITFYETIVTILMIVCFLQHDMIGSPFAGEKYFFEYSIIALTSLTFYWINKGVDHNSNIKLKTLTFSFVGSLFWISMLTVVKLIIYLPLYLFPIYGILLATPFMMLLVTSAEIIKIQTVNPNFHFWKVVLYGFILLIVYQLFMNLWTINDWELIKIFKPKNNAFYF